MPNQTEITLGTRVWDFVTEQYSIIKKIIYSEGFGPFYELDETTPTSEEYNKIRCRFEIGFSISDSHGTIYSKETTLEITNNNKIEIKNTKVQLYRQEH
jgi:hypothetical protein